MADNKNDHVPSEVDDTRVPSRFPFFNQTVTSSPPSPLLSRLPYRPNCTRSRKTKTYLERFQYKQMLESRDNETKRMLRQIARRPCQVPPANHSQGDSARENATAIPSPERGDGDDKMEMEPDLEIIFKRNSAFPSWPDSVTNTNSRLSPESLQEVKNTNSSAITNQDACTKVMLTRKSASDSVPHHLPLIPKPHHPIAKSTTTIKTKNATTTTTTTTEISGGNNNSSHKITETQPTLDFVPTSTESFALLAEEEEEDSEEDDYYSEGEDEKMVEVVELQIQNFDIEDEVVDKQVRSTEQHFQDALTVTSTLLMEKHGHMFSGRISIFNPSDYYHGFLMKSNTEGKNSYTATPNIGTVPPKSKKTVKINLESFGYTPLMAKNDRLFVFGVGMPKPLRADLLKNYLQAMYLKHPHVGGKFAVHPILQEIKYDEDCVTSLANANNLIDDLTLANLFRRGVAVAGKNSNGRKRNFPLLLGILGVLTYYLCPALLQGLGIPIMDGLSDFNTPESWWLF